MLANTIQCTAITFSPVYSSSMTFNACGTIRSNRVGYPDEFKPFLKKGLPERGDYKTIEKENCIFSLWQDNKTVSVLSTNCRNEEGTVTRKQKDGTRKTFTCPLNVIDYNKYK